MPRALTSATPPPPRPRVRRTKTAPAAAPTEGVERAEPVLAAPNRSTMLWVIVGSVTALILLVWSALFRWTLQRPLTQESSTQTATEVRKEFERGLGEFQKNFAAVTTLLNDRFAAETTPKPEEGAVTLSPEALDALEARVNAVGAAEAPVTLAPIDFTLSTWQEFRSSAARLRLQYPKGWVESTRIGGERIAAFVRPTTDGIALGDGELFIDVRPNPENVTLREFYRAQGRVNLYQAATKGTATVYVDGIRAVQFNAVSSVTPSTIASVRHRNRVIEFSVIGIDAEHLQLLQTVLNTVRFE